MGLNYNPTIVPDGLVMYFDIINSRSYSGTGNTIYNLANGGIAVTIVSGITYDNDFRKNLNFNGSSGYMISNNTSMDFSASDFTIQTTLKLNGFTSAYGSIICAGAALTNNSSIFQFIGTGVHSTIGLWHQPTSTMIGRDYNFQTNRIYNVTVTKNTSQIEFFVDGASIGTTSSSNYFNFTANGFAIGRWYYPSYEQYLKGNIYDFKSYNRALSTAEILQNYNASKGRYFTPENIVTNGLVLNIDPSKSNSYSGVGNTIYDLSGFGNTGTLTNGPSFSGLNSGSIVFDGSNDYIDMGNNISNTYSALTIESVIGIGITNKKQAIVSTYNSGLGWGIELLDNTSSNKFNFFGFTSSGVYTSVQSSSSAVLNQTYHVTAVFNTSNSVSLYLNGVINGTLGTNYSSITKGVTTNLRIGDDPDLSQSLYFQGNIYATRLYNKALSATEILQNYNATKSRFGL